MCTLRGRFKELHPLARTARLAEREGQQLGRAPACTWRATAPRLPRAPWPRRAQRGRDPLGPAARHTWVPLEHHRGGSGPPAAGAQRSPGAVPPQHLEAGAPLLARTPKGRAPLGPVSDTSTQVTPRCCGASHSPLEHPQCCDAMAPSVLHSESLPMLTQHGAPVHPGPRALQATLGELHEIQSCSNCSIVVPKLP